ncbi:MAG: ABC transporter substrate-binding protein [Treponema sp.]|nr:ABC transporter substrate-binding protein [Treponema sp.]
MLQESFMKKLLAGALAVVAFCSCTRQSVKEQTRVITDHAGREIAVPHEITRIVITSPWPLPSYFCIFNSEAKKLVGIPPASMAAARYSLLPVVSPDILHASTSFLKGTEINSEELLKLNPDVVFYSSSNTAQYDQCSAAGIPAIGFEGSAPDGDVIATFEHRITLLGEVLGLGNKAKEIIDYAYAVHDEIESRIAAVSQREKPRALILYGYRNGKIETSGNNSFGQYWIDATGGENAAKEIQGFSEINMEQVYAWNPDIIYITNFTPYQPEDFYNNSIAGHDWSAVKAVREGKVYKFPLGMYRWFPPSSDTPLVLKWLATHHQPKLFSDIDMEAETKAYYKRFYGVELRDEDVAMIFAPAREAADY